MHEALRLTDVELYFHLWDDIDCGAVKPDEVASFFRGGFDWRTYLARYDKLLAEIRATPLGPPAKPAPTSAAAAPAPGKPSRKTKR